MAVLAQMITATYGDVLIVEDENGVFGLPPVATTDNYHEVDINTWINNMEKCFNWRMDRNQDSKNAILRPRLYVPGAVN